MTLADQLAHMERTSAFWRERIAGARDLAALPLTTKEELRADQAAHPPFGRRLCAAPEALVRLHVTSGTTGEPVAIGFTRADREANSAIGGAAFAIAGVRAADTIAHCLNYALYAGGVADHLALEETGATVVPIGVGHTRRLLDVIPRLGISALFGTLSFPAHLAARAREAGIDPRGLGLRHVVTAGEPGAGLAAVRGEIERAWGATAADTFGMSDVWSTMAGECGEAEGLHLTTGDRAILELVAPDSGAPVPLEDGAAGELVWTHVGREASPLARYRSGDLGRVWTAPCPCGRRGPRIRIDGRRDDMLRVRGVNVHPGAVGAVLGRFPALGRHAVVADGEPVAPPLRVYVEAPDGTPLDGVAEALRHELNAQFAVVALPPGALPPGEHKTRIVYRTARGDTLPEPIDHARRSTP